MPLTLNVFIMIGFISLFNMNEFFSGLFLGLAAIMAVFGIIVAYKKYYKKPKISLKLISSGEWTKEKHFRGEDSSDEHQELNEVHIFFNLIWRFDIIFQNDSRSNAYNIRFLQLKDFKNIEFADEKLDKNLIVTPNFKEVIPFTFSKTVRVKRIENNKYFTDLPDEFNELSILIEFNSKNRKTYYRRFYFKENKTKDHPMSEHELEHWDFL